LCIQFFTAIDSILGTTYTETYVKERRIQDHLLADMRRLAAILSLGVLVVDEIQRLSLAKSGGADKMLNFFTELISELCVPVVLMGNFKALAIFSGDFSQMRRGTGQGDLIWDQMTNDDQWKLFVESLWRFQYTKKKCSPDDKAYRNQKSSPSLSDVLYEETQGITDFAVKVYMFAQERAIDTKHEVVTGDIIHSVAKDKLGIPREVLHALKTKDKRVLEQYEDLYARKFKDYLHQHPEGVQIVGEMRAAPEIKASLGASAEDKEKGAMQSQPAQNASNILTGNLNSNSPEGGGSGRSTPSRKRVKSTSAPKGVLPGIVAGLKATDNVEVYEALKSAGYIRSADEYLDGAPGIESS
jgi:hypothetical protein